MDGGTSRHLEEVGKQLLIAFHVLGRGHSNPVDHRVNSLLVELVQLQVEGEKKPKRKIISEVTRQVRGLPEHRGRRSRICVPLFGRSAIRFSPGSELLNL